MNGFYCATLVPPSYYMKHYLIYSVHIVAVCRKAYVLDDRVEPEQEDDTIPPPRKSLKPSDQPASALPQQQNEQDTVPPPPPPPRSLKPSVSDREQPASPSTSALPLPLPSPADVTQSVLPVLQSTPVAASVSDAHSTGARTGMTS